MDDGLRELDALFHAGGVLFDASVAGLIKANMPHGIGGSRTSLRRREAADLRHVREKLGGVDGGGQAIMLRHVTDEGAGVDVSVGLRAHNVSHAIRGLQEAEKELDCGALARAVGAKEAGDAVANGEVNPVQGQHSAVTFG